MKKASKQAGKRAFNLIPTLTFLLMAYLVAEDFDRAERLVEEIYAMQESIVFYFRMDALAWIARVKVARGELGQAQRILEGINPGRDLDRSSNFVVASLLVAEAYLNLASGKPERALERMAYLVGRLRQAGVRARFAEALWLQGKAWAALGERERAQQAFLEARAVAEATQARRMLWQILASLAEIEELQGNLSSAQEYRRQARQIIDYIAGHTGSERLRSAFLALPEVRVLS